MKVTHLQSSTQIVHLGDVRVLTDLWLVERKYYGVGIITLPSTVMNYYL